MASFSNFSNLADAFRLKVALLESQEYRHPDFLRKRPTVSEMIFGNEKEIDMTLPIFTDNQEIFAHDTIGRSFMSPTVNSSIRLGTVIKYDTEDIYPRFGIVIPPPPFAHHSGVYVKQVSASEAADFKNKRQVEEVVLNSSSLKDVRVLKKSVKRQRRSEELYNFMFGEGTIDFLDGITAIEFLMLFCILTVFFVGAGIMWMWFW